MPDEFEERLKRLKIVRDNLLSFHKILIDRERMEMERVSGAVTAGQFLNLLMNDENFEWLRTISRVVVKIDQAFELNDGITPDLVTKYEIEIAQMFDGSDSNEEFKRLVADRLPVLPEAEKLKIEIEALLG